MSASPDKSSVSVITPQHVTRAHRNFVELAAVIVDRTAEEPPHTSMADPFLLAFQEMWENPAPESKKLSMYLLFWLRAHRMGEGVGLRSAFRKIIRWLAVGAPDGLRWLREGVPLIPKVGRWDDLETLFGTPLEQAAARLWTDAIIKGDAIACKWAKKNMAPLKQALNCNDATLRKLVTPYRQGQLETMMCERRWSEIRYEELSSSKLWAFREAFKRHDRKRFYRFLKARRLARSKGTWEKNVQHVAEVPAASGDRFEFLRRVVTADIRRELGLPDLHAPQPGMVPQSGENAAPLEPPSLDFELKRLAGAFGRQWNEALDFRRDSIIKNVEQLANGLILAKTESDITLFFKCSNADTLRRALDRLLKTPAAQHDKALRHFLGLAHMRAKQLRPVY